MERWGKEKREEHVMEEKIMEGQKRQKGGREEKSIIK